MRQGIARLESGAVGAARLHPARPSSTCSRTAGIDYAHHLDKPLAPAVDVVLGQLGSSFERVAGTQLTLF